MKVSSTFNPFNTGSDPTRYVELNFGEYYSSGGYNGAASVSIATSVPVVDGNGDLVMPKELKLYGSNISINLLATDLPDLKPRNFTYVIRIGESDPIHVSLPIVEKKVDFDDLVPYTSNGVICYAPHSAITELVAESEVIRTEIARLTRIVETHAKAIEIYAGEVAQGLKGEQGDKGPIGDVGPQGIQGIQGVRGDKGPIGDIGPQGIQGNQGVRGDKGPSGDKGLIGDTGIPGPIGMAGAKGDKGDKGDTGAKGATGDKGPTGDTGLTVPYQTGLASATFPANTTVSNVVIVNFAAGRFSQPPIVVCTLYTNVAAVKEINLIERTATGFTFRMTAENVGANPVNASIGWLAVTAG